MTSLLSKNLVSSKQTADDLQRGPASVACAAGATNAESDNGADLERAPWVV